MMGQDSSTGAGSRHDGGAIADLVERAFQYRGDVTIGLVGGKSVTGYLFNRNPRSSQPFVQLFETGTGREITILYQCITRIEFTGRDAAAASVRHFEDSQRQ